MKRQGNEESPEKLGTRSKQGNAVVDNFLTPVVVLKKIKLSSSDATKFLPELTDADETQEFERERARREGAEKAQPVESEEVSFTDTMTQEELDEHVQRCLEMSLENKINIRNAFALKLIDCFSFLHRKKDFSTMACTLDAGTKIYSCRVDGLHQQVMKLAEEVVIRAKKTDGERGDSDDETLSSKRSAKGQGNGRKNKFIVSAESLTRLMKAKDPKDQYLRFEALPGAILSGARRDANDLSLTLERYTQFWPKWDNYKPLKAEGMVTLPDVKIFREKSETGISEIPQSFIKPEQGETEMERPIEVVDVNHIFEETEEFVNIPAVEPNGCDEEDNHSVTFGDVEDNVSDTSKSGNGEDGVISTAIDRLQADEGGARAPTRTEALKIIFDLSSEYNYLNMKNCNYWAGLEFWKRPQWRTASDKEKRKAPTKTKVPTEIVYDFKDLEERLLKLRKNVNCLQEKTLRSWKKKKTVLPKDLKVDPSLFLNLFHVEKCGGTSEEPENVQSTNFVDVSEIFEDAEEITANSADPFSSDHEDISNSPDPLNATFYEAASRQSEDSEPRDPLDSTFYDAGPSNKEPGKIIRVEVASSNGPEFGESTMVPVPKMVNFDPIKYSTRPIRVDMRHLKNAMLDVMREEVEKDAREKRTGSGSDDGLAESKPQVKFRDVLRSLPRRLERRTRNDVSTAIAFTALLSLTNENNLQLEKCDDGDFAIRFPDVPVHEKYPVVEQFQLGI